MAIMSPKMDMIASKASPFQFHFVSSCFLESSWLLCTSWSTSQNPNARKPDFKWSNSKWREKWRLACPWNRFHGQVIGVKNLKFRCFIQLHDKKASERNEREDAVWIIVSMFKFQPLVNDIIEWDGMPMLCSLWALRKDLFWTHKSQGWKYIFLFLLYYI